jgi:putative hydrolase of the HAD superfamily
MKTTLKYILFDCMETLIDLTRLPTMRDYAFWAYNGSGVEHLWGSFENFFKCYAFAKKSMEDRLPDNKEYEILERFELIAGLNENPGKTCTVEETAKRLYDNYWRNYVSKCYVKSDVREVLPGLSNRYSLGIVSNFMVKDGIEELLEKNNISSYFEFVVTSVKEGWRKPHPGIYNTAIEKTGVLKENILFVGDDFINDFNGPQSMNMKAVLLDRNDKYKDIDQRVTDFYQLERFLKIE